MTGRKSLLQQIRDKESDLDRELAQAIEDSHKIVEDAQRDAGEIIAEAERSASAAAEEYLRKEREALDREIAVLRDNGRKQQAAVQETAGARMSRAVDMIVNAVSLKL